ncbi:MAG: caspase family protein [Myxococcaceae bacterium]
MSRSDTGSGLVGRRLTRTLFLAALGLVSVAHAETRRIALIVGSNAGAGTRAPLRYAESDAGKMARALVEVGEVRPDDVLLLQGQRLSVVEAALLEAKDRVAENKRYPDVRTVLLFYFSGHSDGEALELGQQGLSYSRLRALLAATGADLRLAIIDACKSGAALREKGATRGDPFTLRLSDELTARGEAFITSSAADEYALESSEVMGSFFTHNFLSGLRGAADVSGDRVVTLSEAYRYTYEHTVSNTALMPVGTQHPAYDYRLSGQGELVLSRLSEGVATLVLPKDAERSVVVDLVRDQVVAEVTSAELALAPGDYGVRVLKGGRTYGGRVVLAAGRRETVNLSSLSELSGGAPQISRKGAFTTVEEQYSPRFGIFGVQLGASAGVADGLGVRPTVRFSFDPEDGHGVAFGLLGSHLRSASLSESTVQGRVGYRYVWTEGRWSFSLGADAGAGGFFQDMRDGSHASLLAPLAGPRAGVRFRFAKNLWGTLNGEAVGMLGRVDDRWKLLALPAADAGVLFGW